jgi:microcystin-dependent protein
VGEPFIGEIRMFSFDYPPKGWAPCDGQTMPILQNQPLFSLFGTMYGGDGRQTFGLPDLRNSVAISFGGGHVQGERAGEIAHTLTRNEMPQHPHFIYASGNQATDNTPTEALMLSASLGAFLYSPFNAGAVQPLAANFITPVGQNQPHDNMAPFLAINFCVSLTGIFPSPN